MMGRILTVLMFFGMNGFTASAQAGQVETAAVCQTSCFCTQCCAGAGINCNQTAEKGPTFDTTQSILPVQNTDDAVKAR